MSSSPDRELLTQAAARQLLERAGEIDADSTTVDTLRAAAREAGISDAAFEAALVETRRKMEHQDTPAPRRRTKRLMLAAIAAVLALAGTVFVVIPTRGGSVQSDMVQHEFLVNCLPMNVAQELAQDILRRPGNEVQVSRGSRVLRVRATQSQIGDLQSAIAAAAKEQKSCDNTVSR